MSLHVVNAAFGEFQLGEVVDIDPRLYADEVDAKFLSPIDEHGNRIGDDGATLVLPSSEEEQRQASLVEQGEPVAPPTEPEQPEQPAE